MATKKSWKLLVTSLDVECNKHGMQQAVKYVPPSKLKLKCGCIRRVYIRGVTFHGKYFTCG